MAAFSLVRHRWPKSFGPILVTCLSLLTIVALARPAQAAPNPLDRMQLFRNSDRGVPYLKLSQTGAASSDATIAMRPCARSSSTATRCSTCAATSTRSISTATGVRLRALQRLPLHAGVRRRRRSYGRSTTQPAGCIATRSIATRWRCWTPTATAARTSSIAGQGGGKNGAALRRGTDGRCCAGQRSTQLAGRRMPDRGIPGLRPQHALDPRLGGNRSGCANGWQLHRHLGADAGVRRQPEWVWDRNTCAAGHYVYPVDDNGDGYAGRIFIGRYLYDPSGNRVCTVGHRRHARRRGGGGRSRPGPARAGGGDDRRHRAPGGHLAQNCAVLWTVPNSTINNPQHATLARLDRRHRGPRPPRPRARRGRDHRDRRTDRRDRPSPRPGQDRLRQ